MVRQRSAKPLFIGSIPIAASIHSKSLQVTPRIDSRRHQIKRVITNCEWDYLMIPCVAMYSSPAVTFPSSIFNFLSAR